MSGSNIFIQLGPQPLVPLEDPYILPRLCVCDDLGRDIRWSVGHWIGLEDVKDGETLASQPPQNTKDSAHNHLLSKTCFCWSVLRMTFQQFCAGSNNFSIPWKWVLDSYAILPSNSEMWHWQDINQPVKVKDSPWKQHPQQAMHCSIFCDTLACRSCPCVPTACTQPDKEDVKSVLSHPYACLLVQSEDGLIAQSWSHTGNGTLPFISTSLHFFALSACCGGALPQLHMAGGPYIFRVIDFSIFFYIVLFPAWVSEPPVGCGLDQKKGKEQTRSVCLCPGGTQSFSSSYWLFTG